MSPSASKRPTQTLGTRVREDQYRRLKQETDRRTDPYAPTISQIIQRGIDLALQEIDQMRAAPASGSTEQAP